MFSKYSNGIGILLLDEDEPYVVGDPGNPETFDYRVEYRTVPGASVERVLKRDETLNEAFIAKARELQSAGVRGISGCCGHFVHYQSIVADALDVPVALSSILQVPTVLAEISDTRSIGILIGAADRVSSVNAALTGFDLRRIVVEGVFKHGGAASAFDPDGSIDTSRFERAVTQAASLMVQSNPSIGAVLLETSFFAPYSGAVQEELGLPVVDFVTLIDSLYRSTHHSINSDR